MTGLPEKLRASYFSVFIKSGFSKSNKPCEMELLLKSRRLQNHHDKKFPSRKFEVLKNGVILFKNNTSNYYK